LPFRVISPPKKFLAKLPGPGPRSFLRRLGWGVPGGSPGHILLALLTSTPRSHVSPLTPSDGHASRPRRGPQRTKAANASESHVHSEPQRNFPILSFFLSLRSVVSLLGSFYNLHFRGGTHARQQEQNTLCPVTRPQFFTNTISRCQGKSRSGRPVAVYGAPPQLLPPARVLPCMIMHLFPPSTAAYPAPPSPRSPRADTIFPRPSLDPMDNTTYIPTSMNLLIPQSTGYNHALHSRLLQQSTFFNVES
jgi:hypothetical protein